MLNISTSLFKRFSGKQGPDHMTKIMLVEDDNNLREIYEARLAAEGFDIVSAQDGEAALALAAKEHPDLVLTDVMMPKISGFEMLDILRNTEALKNVKVIMLTALGQAEDSARAGSLGADRYLVKSQVTLEDIVKATHEVLGTDDSTASAALPADAIVIDDSQAVTSSAQPEPVSTPEPTQVAAVVSDTPQTDEPAEVPEVLPEIESANFPEPEVPADIPTQGSGSVDWPVAPDTPVIPTSDVSPQFELPQPEISLPNIDTLPETNNAAPNTDEAASNQSAQELIQAEPAPATPSEAPSEEHSAEVSANEAIPATEEEAAMRAQIDSFLTVSSDDADVTPVEPTPDEPFSDVVTEPLQQNAEIHLGEEPSLPDLTDEEYDKDANLPDHGQLSVHVEPQTISEPQEEAVTSNQITPQPPTETYELPDEPSPAEPQADVTVPTEQVQPAPQEAVQPETPGDKIVSDAVNSMMSATPTFAPYPDHIPETELPTQDQGTPTPSPQPAYPALEETQRRIISPIDQPARPDLNQLLALEDAKAGATRANGSNPAEPTVSNGAQPYRKDQSMPKQNYQGIDPNSISL